MSAYQKIFKLVSDEECLDATKITEIFELMIVANLQYLDEESLLKKIAEKSEFGKSALRTQLTRLKSERDVKAADIGTAIAKHLLKEEFQEGHRLINVPTMGFYCFDDVKWTPITEAQLRKLILPIAEANKAAFPNRQVKAVVSETLQCLKDIAPIYKPDQKIVPIITTQNQEIHLTKEGLAKVQLNAPESYRFSALNFDYNLKAEAPLYEQTMLEIFGACKEPEEVYRHWNEFLGYVIQPERFAPSVWFFIGGGQNGKSSVLKLVNALLGDGAHGTDLKRFQGDRFGARMLLGKLALIDEDYKKDLKLDTGFLKKHSENGLVSCRSPHKMDVLTYPNAALPILVGNHAPLCDDASHGWERRVFVFPFNRKFEAHEIDPHRFSKIMATELPGILNRALAGYGRLRQRGDKFQPPKDCLEAARSMMDLSNPLRLFLQQNLVKATGNFSHVKFPDLKLHYAEWLNVNGYGHMSAPDKNLNAMVTALGYETGPIGGTKVLRGYKLKSEGV